PRAPATAHPTAGPRGPAAARPRRERPAYRTAGAAAAAAPAATAAASTVVRSRSAWTSAVVALLDVAQRAAQLEQWMGRRAALVREEALVRATIELLELRPQCSEMRGVGKQARQGRALHDAPGAGVDR